MLNRRNFLKLAGVTAGVAALPALQADAARLGRLLTVTEAKRAPRASAAITQQLLPDSVHPILNLNTDWVRLPAGWVPQESIQPMLNIHAELPTSYPGWVEVTAPYAALRRYCAPDAPLVARVGHGAVFEALPAIDEPWLKLKLGDGRVGYVQKSAVQAAYTPENTAEDEIEAVIHGHHLTIRHAGKIVAQFAVRRSPQLVGGQITQQVMAASVMDQVGVPWYLATRQGVQIYGVYWHHQLAHTDLQLPPGHVQLSVIAAKAVYGWLRAGDRIFVR